jgi:hypothetical protein
MPCYMFTYHGKATWMPDHARGYVHRIDGLLPPDPNMAAYYRLNQKNPTVRFDESMQHVMVETARNTGEFIKAIVHGCAMENTHLHVVVSWEHDRDWKSMRASIRSAISRALSAKFCKREWFSDSPSRKRVRNHEHFDFLMLVYLPEHSTHWVRDDDRENATKREVVRERPVVTRGKRRRRRQSENQEPN